MALEQKKRARPVSKNGQASKKRQKIEPTENPAPKKPVAVDSLPWNEVQMPEMFDDAEGFYGLEEVDDVEIIKQGDKVQFVKLPLNCVKWSCVTNLLKGF